MLVFCSHLKITWTLFFYSISSNLSYLTKLVNKIEESRNFAITAFPDPEKPYIPRNVEFKIGSARINDLYNDKESDSTKGLIIHDLSVKANKKDFEEISFKKEFPDYFNDCIIENKLEFANFLKSKLPTQKNKKLAIVIKALEEKGILKIEYGELKAFYEAMYIYFKREIGGYESFRKQRQIIQKIDLEKAEKIINEIIIDFKK